MIITEKMIREVQSRVSVTYEEAERLLRKSGGNIEIAVSIAAKHSNSIWSKLSRELHRLYKGTINYRFRITRNENAETFVNVPLFTLLILLLIVQLNQFLFISVVFTVIALLADCHIDIHNSQSAKRIDYYNTVEKKNKKTNEVNDNEVKNKEVNNKEVDNKEVDNSLDNENEIDIRGSKSPIYDNKQSIDEVTKDVEKMIDYVNAESAMNIESIKKEQASDMVDKPEKNEALDKKNTSTTIDIFDSDIDEFYEITIED